MKGLKIIIIGNRFLEFSNNKNILTYDQFNYLTKTEHKLLKNKYYIQLGQGLSDLQIECICQKIKELTLENCFSFIGLMQHIRRATSHFTYKQKIKNCMISEPEQISEDMFRSYLMLDESYAEVSDHASGQHIQGMVLIEAVRQMVNTVTEKFFITSQLKGRKRFILHQLNSSFIEYIFPLEVELILNIERLRYGLDGNFKAIAIVQVKQNQKTKMSAEIDFSLLEKSTILSIERHMAASLVNEEKDVSIGLTNPSAA